MINLYIYHVLCGRNFFLTRIYSPFVLGHLLYSTFSLFIYALPELFQEKYVLESTSSSYEQFEKNEKKIGLLEICFHNFLMLKEMTPRTCH